MHAHDWLLGRRALLLFALLSVLAVGVMVGTDEIGSSTGMRLARLAALGPLLIVLSQRIALQQSESRGELRALAALGASPFRQARGVLVVGFVLAAGTTLLLLLPATDVSSLFPAVAVPESWVPGAASLSDATSGVTVLADGAVRFAEPSALTRSGSAPGREAALVCLAPVSLSALLWGPAPMALEARVLGAAVAAFACIVLLHAFAAGALPLVALLAAGLPLGAQGAWGWLGRSRA